MRVRVSDISGCASAIVQGMSHAAIWAGLYVTGAVACFAQVAGIDSRIAPRAAAAAAAFAFCTATAVYVLDRVKLRDAWLDPADAQAHPARFSFVSRHTKALRVAMVCLLAVASWLGSTLLRGGITVPLLAAVGVFLYAGRPREHRPRPKDILLFKNAYVALGITGFAGIVALAAMQPGAGLESMVEAVSAHPVQVTLSLLHLGGRVLADAVLCDLDDEHADRRFGTDTLPTELGRGRAWSVAFRFRLGMAAALVIMTPLPLWPRLTWAAVTLVSSVSLRLTSPARVRDWVDVRLAVESLVVASALILLRNR